MQPEKSYISNSMMKLFIHFVCIAVFIFSPIFFFQGVSLSEFFLLKPPVIHQFFVSILLVLFFYANYYYLQPQLLFKRKYFFWLIIIIFSFVFILLFSQSIGEIYVKPNDIHFQESKDMFQREPNDVHSMQPRNFFPPKIDKPNRFLGMHLEETILKFLFVLSLSFLLSINDRWKESRKEKRNAELAFLKSQINPHFLFNTLNGIYSLSIIKSEKTQEAIIKLSELMRYVVNETEKDFVSLKNEIQYLKNYIELQQLRFDETVHVNFDDSQADADLMISPLLLIFFVENAFKYGIDSSEVAVIDIQIKTVNKDLIFTVKNKKINAEQDYTSQKGLKNVIRRLELIYPNRHSLNIDNSGEYFFIKLIINSI